MHIRGTERSIIKKTKQYSPLLGESTWRKNSVWMCVRDKKVNKKKGRETERQIQKQGEGGQPLFQSSVMSTSVSRNQHCLGVYWSRESQLHSRDQNPNYLTIFTLWNSGGTSKKLAQRIEYCTFKLPLFGEFCCYIRQFFHDICKITIVD